MVSAQPKAYGFGRCCSAGLRKEGAGVGGAGSLRATWTPPWGPPGWTTLCRRQPRGPIPTAASTASGAAVHSPSCPLGTGAATLLVAALTVACAAWRSPHQARLAAVGPPRPGHRDGTVRQCRGEPVPPAADGPSRPTRLRPLRTGQDSPSQRTPQPDRVRSPGCEHVYLYSSLPARSRGHRQPRCGPGDDGTSPFVGSDEALLTAEPSSGLAADLSLVAARLPRHHRSRHRRS